MSPRIKPESRPLPPPAKGVFQLRPKVWVGLFLLAALGVGAHFLWRTTSSRIARDPHYLLTSDNIHISPPPSWIRSDIKSQALRNAGLDGTLSVLDDWEVLSKRVKDAFEFHPWIAKVERITRKMPHSLAVDVQYRKPVAAVESSDVGGVMFLPIDENAIRLPEDDLTDTERRYLPRVSGIMGRPLVGDRWEDARVLGGAKLAAQLADVWQQLRLVEIIANPQNSPHAERQLYRFELVTTGGTRIVWGMPPGDEMNTGESPFIQKRQRLIDYAAQYGKLESIDGPEILDVRNDLVVTPHTAKHKKAAPVETETQTK